jgi:hypothetical protein
LIATDEPLIASFIRYRVIGQSESQPSRAPLEPAVLKGAVDEAWAPYRWGASSRALTEAAGEDEVKVTVTQRGKFEV